MTIDAVAVDDPVQASTMNQLILGANGSPGVAVITSSGSWSVPDGVHKFRVTLCGGGGGGGPAGSGGGGEDYFTTQGGPGGDSVARRIWVSGVDPGTTYSITIGAAGTGGSSGGGATSFGTLLTVSGGAVGAGGPGTYGGVGAKGAPGTITGGSLSGSALAVGNKSVAIYNTPNNIPQAFGEGGLVTGDYYSPGNGAPGICIIEW